MILVACMLIALSQSTPSLHMHSHVNKVIDQIQA